MLTIIIFEWIYNQTLFLDSIRETIMTTEPGQAQPNSRALFIARAAVILVNVAISAAILFISAGQTSWPAGWVYLSSYLFFNWTSAYLSISGRKEISMPEKGARWDRALSQAFRLSHPVTLILAGLEFRFFSPYSLMPAFIQTGGFVLLLFSFGLIAWARKVNPYYGYEVPRQEKWEQEIITNGPYEFIRHPGNSGLILLAVARPVALGSVYALIPGVFGVLIILLQTFFEDRALTNGVPGYSDYAKGVKYRLFEYLW